MAPDSTQDLEEIIVDGSWKKQGLVVAVADHTPLELNATQSVNGHQKVPLRFLPLQLAYNLGSRLAGINPQSAPRRVLKSFPNILEQVNEEDLVYFARQIEVPLAFMKLKGFDNTRVILNRAFEPYLLYAALRELAANSDEKTVNFVYILAHSGGRMLSNTPLSKYNVGDNYLRQHAPEVERFLTRLPPEQVYHPSDISQRLRSGKGVNLLYVESCCAGDLFEGNMPPRTVFIATSETDQLNGGYWLNRSFKRAYERELLRSHAYADTWESCPVDITNLSPDRRLPFDILLPPDIVEEANRLKQQLEGTDFKPFKPNVSLVIKSNIRLAV